MSRRWQFSLSSLMLATAGLSVAAALIARFGVYAVILLGLCSLVVGVAGRAHGRGVVATAGFCGFCRRARGNDSGRTSGGLGRGEDDPAKVHVTRFGEWSRSATAIARGFQPELWVAAPDAQIARSKAWSSATRHPIGSARLPWTFAASGHEGYFEHTGQIYFQSCLLVD